MRRLTACEAVGKLKIKLQSTEIDFLRRAARCYRLARITNEVIREKKRELNITLRGTEAAEMAWEH